ncbi:rhoptry protein 5b [Cystoisospora suis]|uniref:Rhoptry protein 5b n=1 Tax=Cystoisospora suis TaxID=483139 RepID=A0A2C6L826_9APIC|nr:rhoptry protein 5b [Cystoisospora suis]
MAGCHPPSRQRALANRLRRVSSTALLFPLVLVFFSFTPVVVTGGEFVAGRYGGPDFSHLPLPGFPRAREQGHVPYTWLTNMQPSHFSPRLTTSRISASPAAFPFSHAQMRGAVGTVVTSQMSAPAMEGQRIVLSLIKQRPVEVSPSEDGRAFVERSSDYTFAADSSHAVQGEASMSTTPAETGPSAAGDLGSGRALQDLSSRSRRPGQRRGVQGRARFRARKVRKAFASFKGVNARLLRRMMLAGSEALKKAAGILKSSRVALEGTPQQEAVGKCFPQREFFHVSSVSPDPHDSLGGSVLRGRLLVQNGTTVLYEGKFKKMSGNSAAHVATLQFFVNESSSYAEAPREIQVQEGIKRLLMRDRRGGPDLLNRVMSGATYRMPVDLLHRVDDLKQRVSPLLQVLPAVEGTMSDLAQVVATTTDTAMAAEVCSAALLQTLGVVGLINWKGVVHGHINADNLFINAEGHVMIGGFRFLHKRGKSYLREPGSAEYEAPEIHKANKLKYRPTIDAWSVGVVMYQVCCGRLPYGMHQTGLNPPYSKILPVLQILRKPSKLILDTSVCPNWVPTPVKNTLMKLLKPTRRQRLAIMRPSKFRAVGSVLKSLVKAEETPHGQHLQDTVSSEGDESNDSHP